MEEIKEKLEELKGLIGTGDTRGRERMEKITSWLRENATSDEQRAMVRKFLEEGMNAEVAELQRIRDQIAENYNLLPISYIAKNYFGKSASWLMQRINGNRVRGKVYTLNDEQKATFNAAVQDIAKRIGSVCIA